MHLGLVFFSFRQYIFRLLLDSSPDATLKISYYSVKSLRTSVVDQGLQSLGVFLVEIFLRQ